MKRLSKLKDLRTVWSYSQANPKHLVSLGLLALTVSKLENACRISVENIREITVCVDIPRHTCTVYMYMYGTLAYEKNVYSLMQLRKWGILTKELRVKGIFGRVNSNWRHHPFYTFRFFDISISHLTNFTHPRQLKIFTFT